MDEFAASLIFIATLFILLGGGVWVGAALLLTAVLGMFLFTSRPVGDAMALTIWGAQSSWTLTALPLFIWMGEILFRSKLSESLFTGLTPFMRRLPGRLPAHQYRRFGDFCLYFRLIGGNGGDGRQNVYSRIEKRAATRKK